MNLTVRRLSLYSGMPDAPRAASEIRRACVVARNVAFRKLGRVYKEDAAANVLASVYADAVQPVQDKWREVGAADSEPRGAILSWLVDQVAKRYNLDNYQANNLYYLI